MCKEWEENHYWDHVDAKGKIFYRVMLDDFTQSMRIPKKFIDHVSGELSVNVHLKDPSGCTWQSELINTNCGSYLRSGWKDFAETHHLEENDLLIFEYEGNSSFKINILEVGGCEKAHSYCLKIDNLLKQERSEDSVETLTAMPSSKATKSSCSSKSHEDVVVLHKQTSFTKINRSIGSRCGAKIPRSNELDGHAVKMDAETSENVDGNDRETLSYPPILIARRTNPLPAREEKAAKRLARVVSSGNPFFVSVMRASYVGYNTSHLLVPSGFRSHLPTEKGSILLKVSGRRKKWYCRF